MNYRVKPPLAGTRLGGLLLALILPPLNTGMSQNVSSSILGSGYPGLPDSDEGSRPYLGVVGPPPLRFQEQETVAQKETPNRPPAGAPPVPTGVHADGGPKKISAVPDEPRQTKLPHPASGAPAPRNAPPTIARPPQTEALAACPPTPTRQPARRTRRRARN